MAHYYGYGQAAVPQPPVMVPAANGAGMQLVRPPAAPGPQQTVMAPAWVAAMLGGFQELAAQINENIRQLFGTRLDRNEEFAFLPLIDPPLAVAAGAVNIRGTCTVGQEADYVAVAIMAMANADPAPTPPVPMPHAFRFHIIDGSTGRELQSEALPAAFIGAAAAGVSAPGQLPLFLPKPRIFSRNSQVFIDFDNTQGVNILIDWTFLGYRIYDVDSLDLTQVR